MSTQPRSGLRLRAGLLLIGAMLATTLIIAACQSGRHVASLGALSSVVAEESRGYEVFQNHCAACHGRQGRGDGTFAFVLDTAPRDFWNEPFRYVSTLDGIPTREDVIQSISHGRTNGEMPAGPWLNEDELSAVADFVVELNRLGWEQRLRDDFAGEGLSEAEIREISFERVTTEQPIEVSAPSLGFVPDMRRGRELYVQSCASCHGAGGRGDGLDMPLDDRGRPISVRDLVSEPIRGGDGLVELFKRIRCGVPGTPMPAQELLEDDDIWQLVHYTRHLMGRPRTLVGP